MRRIRIKLPKEAYLPEEPIKGDVKLYIDRPVLAKAIKLDIIGLEETHIPIRNNGFSRIYREHNFILKKKIAFQEPIHVQDLELGPGEHVFHFDFKMPEYSLPSYSGKHAFITYRLRARVDAPIVSDMTDDQPIHVFRRRNALDILKYPAHFWSENYFSSHKDRPSFYVELAQTGYKAGDVIVAFMTLKNMGLEKIRNIDIRLLGDEFALAQGCHKTVLQYKREINIPTDDIVEGIPIQLLFPTPRVVPSSYEGFLSKFRWAVEIGLNIPAGRDIKALHPLEILS